MSLLHNRCSYRGEKKVKLCISGKWVSLSKVSLAMRKYLLFNCSHTENEPRSELLWSTLHHSVFSTQATERTPNFHWAICLRSAVTFKRPRTLTTDKCATLERTKCFQTICIERVFDEQLKCYNPTWGHSYIYAHYWFRYKILPASGKWHPLGLLLKGFACCLWCEIPIENQCVFCSGQFCPDYLIVAAV